MKVAILIDTLSVGGAERQAILCVTELRKLGNTVDLIYYHPAVAYTAMLQELQVHPIYVAARSFPERCRKLRKLFRQKRYDIVHGFKMAAEVYAALAGTVAGIPRRFGSFRSVYNLGPQYCAMHYAVDKLLSGWIVNSRVGAESLARRTRVARGKIAVLHNGVNTALLTSTRNGNQAKAALGLPPTATVVTMIARLEPGKNHHLLISAAGKVLAQEANTRFLIVGQGSLGSSLQAFAREQGVAEQVLFLGQRSDIGEILAATDISVLTTDFEGMPNALLESMAAGKAIACTHYAGVEEVLSKDVHALTSPPGDADGFAANVLCLIRNPSLRERLGCAGRQHAQAHFSNAAMGRNLQRIYLQLNRNGHGNSH